MKCNLSVASAAAVLTAFLAWPGSLTAQTETEQRQSTPLGITVNGEGTADSPPDRIAMAVDLQGSGDRAGEAVVKFRGQRERFVEAVEALGIEDLKISGGDVRVAHVVANQNRYPGNQLPTAGGTFHVQERIRIDMPVGDDPLETAARLYDLGGDLSVQFTPPDNGGDLVEPVFTQSDDAEQRATQQAIDAARGKADRIAEAIGQKVIGVLAVQVMESPNTGNRPNYYAGNQLATAGDPQPLSQKRTTIRVRVRFKTDLAAK